jgi:hypothetical protein
MKIIVGMRYRIKKFKSRPGHWNKNGEMDKWMGQSVTIRRMGGSINIVEDKNKWSWRLIDFEEMSGLRNFNISDEDFLL